jgi:hypothetical protein
MRTFFWFSFPCTTAVCLVYHLQSLG